MINIQINKSIRIWWEQGGSQQRHWTQVIIGKRSPDSCYLRPGPGHSLWLVSAGNTGHPIMSHLMVSIREQWSLVPGDNVIHQALFLCKLIRWSNQWIMNTIPVSPDSSVITILDLLCGAIRQIWLEEQPWLGGIVPGLQWSNHQTPLNWSSPGGPVCSPVSMLDTIFKNTIVLSIYTNESNEIPDSCRHA